MSLRVSRSGVRRFRRGFTRCIFETLERRRVLSVQPLDIAGSAENFFRPLDGNHVSGVIFEMRSPSDLTAYTVDINWGDGTKGLGTIVSLGDDVYGVVAEHTYAGAGVHGVDLYLIENEEMLTQNVPTLLPQAGELTSVSQKSDLNYPERFVIRWDERNETINIGSFVDRAPTPLGDYSLTIDWGDGTQTNANTLRMGAGNVLVGAEHAWPRPGDYDVTYTVTRPDGQSLTETRFFTLAATPTVEQVASTITGEIEWGQNGSGQSAWFHAQFSGEGLAGHERTNARAWFEFGDGTVVEGWISDWDGAGNWHVGANHVYERAGDFEVKVHLQLDVGPRAARGYSGVPVVENLPDMETAATAQRIVRIDPAGFEGFGKRVNLPLADAEMFAGEVVVAKFILSDPSLGPNDFVSDIHALTGLDDMPGNDGLPDPTVRDAGNGVWVVTLPPDALVTAGVSYQVELFDNRGGQPVVGIAYGRIDGTFTKYIESPVNEPNEPPAEEPAEPLIQTPNGEIPLSEWHTSDARLGQIRQIKDLGWEHSGVYERTPATYLYGVIEYNISAERHAVPPGAEPIAAHTLDVMYREEGGVRRHLLILDGVEFEPAAGYSFRIEATETGVLFSYGLIGEAPPILVGHPTELKPLDRADEGEIAQPTLSPSPESQVLLTRAPSIATGLFADATAQDNDVLT